MLHMMLHTCVAATAHTEGLEDAVMMQWPTPALVHAML